MMPHDADLALAPSLFSLSLSFDRDPQELTV